MPRAAKALLAGVRDLAGPRFLCRLVQNPGPLRIHAARALASEPAPDCIDDLAPLVSDADSAIATAVIEILKSSRPGAVGEALIFAAASRTPEVNAWARRMLRIRDRDELQSELTQSLTNPSGTVRKAAVEVLVRMPDRLSLRAVLDIASGSDRPLAGAALEALSQSAATEATAALGAILVASPESGLRRVAAGALGKRGGAGSVEYLLSGLADPDAIVRVNSAESLEALTKRTFEDDAEAWEAWALEMGSPGAVLPSGLVEKLLEFQIGRLGGRVVAHEIAQAGRPSTVLVAASFATPSKGNGALPAVAFVARHTASGRTIALKGRPEMDEARDRVIFQRGLELSEGEWVIGAALVDVSGKSMSHVSDRVIVRSDAGHRGSLSPLIVAELLAPTGTGSASAVPRICGERMRLDTDATFVAGRKLGFFLRPGAPLASSPQPGSPGLAGLTLEEASWPIAKIEASCSQAIPSQVAGEGSPPTSNDVAGPIPQVFLAGDRLPRTYRLVARCASEGAEPYVCGETQFTLVPGRRPSPTAAPKASPGSTRSKAPQPRKPG